MWLSTSTNWVLPTIVRQPPHNSAAQHELGARLLMGYKGRNRKLIAPYFLPNKFDMDHLIKLSLISFPRRRSGPLSSGGKTTKPVETPTRLRRNNGFRKRLTIGALAIFLFKMDPRAHASFTVASKVESSYGRRKRWELTRKRARCGENTKRTTWPVDLC